LAAIRLAVGKLTGARLLWDAESPVDLVNQGDRMVQCYENWLLDDEQKQMLSLQPEDKFILLCILLFVRHQSDRWPRASTAREDLKDDRARAYVNQSLSIRSCQLIRDSWQDLGVPGKAFVGIISRICLKAGAADDSHFTSAEPEAAVTDETAVNIPLLAAYLQLCRALDLKTPATLLQKISHIPEDNHISPGRLEAYFSVAEADGYSEAWQQQVLKSFVKY